MRRAPPPRKMSSGNLDDDSSGGARGDGHATRSREQPNPQFTVRFRHFASREGAAAAQGLHDVAPPVVGAGASGDGVTKVKEEEQEEETLAQQRERLGLSARVPARHPRHHQGPGQHERGGHGRRGKAHGFGGVGGRGRRRGGRSRGRWQCLWGHIIQQNGASRKAPRRHL